MDITSLQQTANDNDRLMASWINDVRTQINQLKDANAFTNQQMADLRNQLVQSFQITATSGLTVAITGGLFKNSQAVVIRVAAATLQVTDNAYNFIYVDDTGKIIASASRPSVGFEIGVARADKGKIVEVVNFPLFESRTRNTDQLVDGFRTLLWKPVCNVVKTQPFVIPGRDKYYIIPFEAIAGQGFNTGGEFRAPSPEMSYKFQCNIRVDTQAVQTQMAAKLSLFLGEDEVNVPLQQGDSARGDITFNAENGIPLKLDSNQVVTVKIYLSLGRDCRVREGSNVQVWQIPS